jgi:lysosomal Pro-X carboxypeptidase
MFWDQAFNLNSTIRQCQEVQGTTPLPLWAEQNYGGRDTLKSTSNIVFSNGALDPWKGGGVSKNYSESVTAIVIQDAGHHVDLMFSTPDDTPAIRNARAFEMAQVKKWIAQKAETVAERQRWQ